MSNVYLEKIASMADAGRVVGEGVAKGVKAVGRVAAKGAKAFGSQVDKSIGGVYINHARKLGITDPYKLADAADVKKLRRMHAESKLRGNRDFGKAKAAFGDFDKNVLPHLKRETRNARITVGAVTGGTAYGVHKVKEKMDEPKVQSYNYY